MQILMKGGNKAMLWFLLGMIVGGTIGVFVMCCMQISSRSDGK